jgi:hypothetical protein
VHRNFHGQIEIFAKVQSLYTTVDKRVELLKSVTDSILYNTIDLTYAMERNLYILVGLGSFKYADITFFSTSFIHST